jgi:hypothetical protein
MIERSSGPSVASTIACAVPAGKIMTMESGSGPCSIFKFGGVDVRGAVDGDAIGFVEGCSATTGAAGDVIWELSISTAVVSGMLMKRT